MRIIFSLFLILTHSFCYCQTERELTFHVQYNPETIYRQALAQTFQNEIRYSGSEEFLQKLSDNGVQNPTIMNIESKIGSIFKTGKLTEGKKFPITIEFDKASSNDGNKIFPDGTLIYGHGSIGNMPTLDSIISTEMDEEFKTTLLQTAQSIFSQINIPEQKVKVGESFSVESPLSFPVEDMDVKMVITSIYKLLSVTNNIAEFDVSQEFTMNTSFNTEGVMATGTGKGKLSYDILNNFYKKYEFDTEIIMNMKHEVFDLEVTSKSRMIQTVEIEKNIAFDQKKECKKFKNGKFLLVDPEVGNSIIERKGSNQIEYGEGSKLKVKLKVKWLDDCTYTLTLKKVLENPNKLELPEKMIVKVEIIETKDNSYIQKSTSNLDDMILENEIIILN